MLACLNCDPIFFDGMSIDYRSALPEVLPRSPSFQLVRCDHHDVTLLFQLPPRINLLLWYNSTPSGLQNVQGILERHADQVAHSRCRIEVQEGKVLTASTARAREHANGWFCEPFLQHLCLERSYKLQTSTSAPISVARNIPQAEPHTTSSQSPQSAPTPSNAH